MHTSESLTCDYANKSRSCHASLEFNNQLRYVLVTAVYISE